MADPNLQQDATDLSSIQVPSVIRMGRKIVTSVAGLVGPPANTSQMPPVPLDAMTGLPQPVRTGLAAAQSLDQPFSNYDQPDIAGNSLASVAQVPTNWKEAAMAAAPLVLPGIAGKAVEAMGGKVPELPWGEGREPAPPVNPRVPPSAPDAASLADAYNAQRGQPPIQRPAPGINEDFSRHVARAYDKLPVDDSANPDVQRAYAALNNEINQQWDHARAAGYNLEPWTSEGQPYKNSTEMAQDVANNKHLYFFTGGEPHPLLGAIDPETGLSANDKFRAVHDLFGHAAPGFSFGPVGEEGAYRTHVQMFSPEAAKAMATETRGQNSWVNYGDHNYGPNGQYLNVPPPERPFAQQKVALLPDPLLTNNPDTQRVSIGLDTGEGTPLRNSGITTIPPEVADQVVNRVADKAGVHIGERSSGLGAYMTSTEPSMHPVTDGSPENIDAFKHAIGHALQQTEVISTKPDMAGNGYAFDVLGDGLGTDAERARFYTDLKSKLGDSAADIVPGFQPIQENGKPGLRFLKFDGPMDGDTINTLQKAVNDIGAGRDYPVDTKHAPIEISSTSNDWRTNPNGEGYTSRLTEAGRPDLSEWLNNGEHWGAGQPEAPGTTATGIPPAGLAQMENGGVPAERLQAAPGRGPVLPEESEGAQESIIPRRPAEEQYQIPRRPAEEQYQITPPLPIAQRMGSAIFKTLYPTGILEGHGPAAQAVVGEGGTVAPAVSSYTRSSEPSWLNDTPGPESFGIHIPGDRTVANPGIYDVANTVRDAREMVAPESPNLKNIFGVTRDDLWNISQQGRRPGNITERPYKTAANPKGAKHAPDVMTPENTQRILDVLEEAQKYPDLYRSMASWYVADPIFQRMVELHGENAIPAYNRFNSIMSMASPMSDVVTEIHRGTGANWMQEMGRFNDFKKYGSQPAEDRPRAVRSLMMDIPGNTSHSMAQVPGMERYFAGLGVDSKWPKVPSYILASGVPETGFQTIYPVGDTHWASGVGLSDTRPLTSHGVIGSANNTEMVSLTPWYQKIAAEHGVQPVSAQAIQWGALAPATGVRSQIGAPKIEILADQIANRAAKLGISPQEMRDRVLMFRDMVTLPPVGLGIGLAGAGAAGTVIHAGQDQGEYKE